MSGFKSGITDYGAVLKRWREIGSSLPEDRSYSAPLIYCFDRGYMVLQRCEGCGCDSICSTRMVPS